MTDKPRYRVSKSPTPTPYDKYYESEHSAVTICDLLNNFRKAGDPDLQWDVYEIEDEDDEQVQGHA